MHRFFPLSVRFAFAAAIGLASAHALPALAQTQTLTTATGPAAILAVDIPAANALVSNGKYVDIGGWTAGSRVDVYLDGPAGFGTGIGSTDVDEPRPDVAMKMQSPNLEDSGFDVPWLPMDLSVGPHTLYVYSLVDGQWAVQSRTIMGEGNIIPNPNIDDGQDDAAPAGTGSTDSGFSGTF